MAQAVSETRMIQTRYWSKPIPETRYDWEATFPDMNENSPVGFGSSEIEAIRHLLEIVEKIPCTNPECILPHGRVESCNSSL